VLLTHVFPLSDRTARFFRLDRAPQTSGTPGPSHPCRNPREQREAHETELTFTDPECLDEGLARRLFCFLEPAEADQTLADVCQRDRLPPREAHVAGLGGAHSQELEARS
jgi:hypothetical protein